MNEFLQFFNEKRKAYPMHLVICYSSISDWCVHVYKGASHLAEDEEIAYAHNCDIELCFAKAQVALKEWFLEHEGGY